MTLFSVFTGDFALLKKSLHPCVSQLLAGQTRFGEHDSESSPRSLIDLFCFALLLSHPPCYFACMQSSLSLPQTLCCEGKSVINTEAKSFQIICPAPTVCFTVCTVFLIDHNLQHLHFNTQTVTLFCLYRAFHTFCSLVCPSACRMIFTGRSSGRTQPCSTRW